MEKLTRENIYVPLEGKSKEELTELYNFLESAGEKQYRETLNDFLDNYKYYETYRFNRTWTLGWYVNSKDKQEVTIQQLKEILQPMELSLTEQLEKAEAEVKRLKEAIEEESKPKNGDLVIFERGKYKVIFELENEKLDGLENICGGHFQFKEKITDQELINKLNELIK